MPHLVDVPFKRQPYLGTVPCRGCIVDLISRPRTEYRHPAASSCTAIPFSRTFLFLWRETVFFRSLWSFLYLQSVRTGCHTRANHVWSGSPYKGQGSVGCFMLFMGDWPRRTPLEYLEEGCRRDTVQYLKCHFYLSGKTHAAAAIARDAIVIRSVGR